MPPKPKRKKSPSKPKLLKVPPTVCVLLYHHRYGTDAIVLKDEECAKEGIRSLMNEYLDEIEEPLDQEKVMGVLEPTGSLEQPEEFDLTKALQLWAELTDESFEFNTQEVLSDLDTTELKRDR